MLGIILQLIWRVLALRLEVTPLSRLFSFEEYYCQDQYISNISTITDCSRTITQLKIIVFIKENEITHTQKQTVLLHFKMFVMSYSSLAAGEGQQRIQSVPDFSFIKGLDVIQQRQGLFVYIPLLRSCSKASLPSLCLFYWLCPDLIAITTKSALRPLHHSTRSDSNQWQAVPLTTVYFIQLH